MKLGLLKSKVLAKITFHVYTFGYNRENIGSELEIASDFRLKDQDRRPKMLIRTPLVKTIYTGLTARINTVRYIFRVLGSWFGTL